MRTNIFIALCLVLLIAPLRLWRLAEAPPDFYFDEGAHGIDALSVLAGEHSPFFTTNHGREAMIVYTTAAMIPVFGRSVLAVRFPVALAGVLTVLAIFWLGQLLFRTSQSQTSMPNTWERWKGQFIAATAAGLFAVSLSQTILGRTGYRANFLILLLPVALALLWLGIHKRSSGHWVAAGIVTGLMAYTYTSARVTPFLFLSLAVVAASSARLSPAELVRRYAKPAVCYVAVAFVVASPLLLYFAIYPSAFFMRMGDVSLFASDRSFAATVEALLRNLWLHLGAFGFVGDPRPLANLGSRPLLNVVEAGFFWIGVACALWQRKPAHWLLLLWLGIMLVPTLLSVDWDYPPPNFLRMSSTLPATYLLISVGLWQTGLLAARIAGRYLPAPQATRLALFGVATVASGMVAIQGYNTYRSYFNDWVEQIYTVAYPSWMDLTRQVNSERPGASPVYVIPRSETEQSPLQYNFEFLYQRNVPAYVFQTVRDEFPSQLYQALTKTNMPALDVYAVDWGRDWRADPTGRIPFLLGKYGQFTEQQAYADYTISQYANLQRNQEWTLYEHMQPITINYDAGITLKSAAIGLHGGEQLDLAAEIIYQPFFWLVLHWQAEQPTDKDYKISLRLYNEAGERLFLQDWTPYDALYRTSSQWEPFEPIESLHLLNLPANLPAGAYVLNIVVYDQESLTPIVQVGSWQPEVTLARFIVP